MKATKGNKTYTITEQDKKRYQDAGFDIQDDNGGIIAHGRGKSVPIEQYLELEEKYEKLSQQYTERSDKCQQTDTGGGQGVSSGIPLKEMSPEELLVYAAERGIDIGNSTSRDGILKKIRDAEKAGE